MAVLWDGLQGRVSLGDAIVIGETGSVEVVPLHEPDDST